VTRLGKHREGVFKTHEAAFDECCSVPLILDVVVLRVEIVGQISSNLSDLCRLMSWTGEDEFVEWGTSLRDHRTRLQDMLSKLLDGFEAIQGLDGFKFNKVDLNLRCEGWQGNTMVKVISYKTYTIRSLIYYAYGARIGHEMERPIGPDRNIWSRLR
jgi:hypothetical protein